jgi:hypothetical protein
MKSFLKTTVCSIGGLALICLVLKPAQEQTTTSRIVNAANAFVSTLDDKQRQAVLYSFKDEEQRKRWSNFPTTVVPRGGISLKQISKQQRASAMELLSIVLSPMGLEKVIQGPHLVIEYAPQNDEPANHVHTIYRDPTNDYGR